MILSLRPTNHSQSSNDGRASGGDVSSKTPPNNPGRPPRASPPREGSLAEPRGSAPRPTSRNSTGASWIRRRLPPPSSPSGGLRPGGRGSPQSFTSGGLAVDDLPHPCGRPRTPSGQLALLLSGSPFLRVSLRRTPRSPSGQLGAGLGGRDRPPSSDVSFASGGRGRSCFALALRMYEQVQLAGPQQPPADERPAPSEYGVHPSGGRARFASLRWSTSVVRVVRRIINVVICECGGAGTSPRCREGAQHTMFKVDVVDVVRSTRTTGP